MNEVKRPSEAWYTWTPAGTCITERWRKLGWVPPSEDPRYLQKWAEWKRKLYEGAREPEPALPTNVTAIPKSIRRSR